MQRQSRTVQALARGARLAAGLAAAPALGLAGARLTTTVLMALGAAVLRAGALAAADFTAAGLGAADFAAAVRDAAGLAAAERGAGADRESTRLNSRHLRLSYAGFCLKKKK